MTRSDRDDHNADLRAEALIDSADHAHEYWTATGPVERPRRGEE